jgi:hypothetical protein
MADPTRLEDGQPKNNTKRNWLIGCGGCLVVIIVGLIIAAVVGASCVGQFQKGSDEAIQAIFGGTPPGGYTNFGFSIPDKSGKKNNVVMMINPTDPKKIVFAIDTYIPDADTQKILSGDSKQIEDFLKDFAASDLESATAKGAKGMDMKNLRLEGMQQVKLANGKIFPVVNVKIAKENEFTPAAAGMLVLPDNRLVLLMGLDSSTTASTAEMDFKPAYESLSTSVINIVNDSALDDQLVSKQK